jgi:hypothetical protein
MTNRELRSQELNRHEEVVDRNIEDHQDVNLDQKKRSIATANRNSAIARVVNIVYYLFGALELLLGIRVILQLTGANAANGFARFIYALSGPVVAMFSNLLPNPTLSETAVLEITTIIAMLVWAVVAWLVGRLTWLVMSRPR